MTTIPPCAICGFDLQGTVLAGLRTCPECGWEFTDNDMVLLGPSDKNGEPRSLRGNEPRIKGWLLLLMLLLISATFVTLAVVLPRL